MSSFLGPRPSRNWIADSGSIRSIDCGDQPPVYIFQEYRLAGNAWWRRVKAHDAFAMSDTSSPESITMSEVPESVYLKHMHMAKNGDEDTITAGKEQA